MVEERINRGGGQLPFGAEYMIATYLDDRGAVVAREAATRVAIVCYDATGETIAEAFGMVNAPRRLARRGSSREARSRVLRLKLDRGEVDIRSGWTYQRTPLE